MKSVRERFEAETYPDPNSGCFIWGGSEYANGYGRFYVRFEGGKQIYALAHRYALILAGIDLPAGSKVLHSCDCRLCVNPDHLRIGTTADNAADMARRGRGRKRPDGGLPPGVKRTAAGRFVAYAATPGQHKTSYLGTYDSIAEAASVAAAVKTERFEPGVVLLDCTVADDLDFLRIFFGDASRSATVARLVAAAMKRATALVAEEGSDGQDPT